MPSSEAEELRRQRRALAERHAAGASGLEIARGLSDAVDATIRSVWDRVGGHPGAALVAVGGYGRQEMCPHSDVDLIVLHGRRDDVTTAAKALAYELWDTGAELGYALHTPGEALRLAGQRFDSQASFLDARLVTGNAELFGDWDQRCLARLRRSLPSFMENLRVATIERRARAGDAGAELEPNLKEGRGGLRDLAIIRWLNRVGAPGGVEPQPLEPGADALAAATEFLLRVRNQLHFKTDRRTDVLAMHEQAEVAAALGIPEGDLAPEDALMREIYGHCRTAAHAVDRALFAVPEVHFGPSPPATLPEPWPPEVREQFFVLLRSTDLRQAFESLDQSGALVATMPEWAGIRCLPQRNVYHRFAVDVHSVQTVSALAGLSGNDNPIIAGAAAEAEADGDLLALGCLIHDIGKGSGEDHSVRGEALAASVGRRIGLEPQAAADLAWLVRHHLLLAETATRRDIRDERVILKLAETVGSARMLRLLLLVSAADGIATGPSAWGPWKATLVTRLYARVLHLLEQGELVGADIAEVVQRREGDLRAALAGFPPALVEAHLANMPREWLLSQAPAGLIRQSQAMMGRPPRGEISISAELQPESGVWEVAVVGLDRPGLFSKVSGALGLHGLNVLGAEIYTREDGVALELFRLEAIGDEERRFERVREDVAKALRGRLSLDVRLSEKRHDYAGRSKKGKGEPPRVVVDNHSSDFYTLIDVHAEDSIGLLYAVTKALTELQLDIHKAKISTYGDDVVDVFYVRDLEGTKASEPDHVAEIERTVLFALKGTSSISAV